MFCIKIQLNILFTLKSIYNVVEFWKSNLRDWLVIDADKSIRNHTKRINTGFWNQPDRSKKPKKIRRVRLRCSEKTVLDKKKLLKICFITRESSVKCILAKIFGLN